MGAASCDPRPDRSDGPNDRHALGIGGSGATNTDLDDSFGGIAFSYGQYISETLAVVLRQSINYSNPNIGSAQWNGSTRIAIDQHVMARGKIRPFIGANFGRIYGDGVRDT